MKTVKNMLSFLKRADLFGDPVNISYKRRTQHPSALGGFTTLFLVFGFTIYATWRFHRFNVYDKNSYLQNISIKRFDEIGSFQLN